MTHGPIYKMIKKIIAEDGMMYAGMKGPVLNTILPQIQELELRWISVKDSLPPIEKEVLCFDDYAVVGHYINDIKGNFYWEEPSSGQFYPTHWQHLPLPPK